MSPEYFFKDMSKYSDGIEDLAKSSSYKVQLLTGATGFLGGHYLYFRSQGPGQFLVMTRDESSGLGFKRLEAALKTFAASYEIPKVSNEALKKISVVKGDLSQEDLSLDEAQLTNLEKQNVDEIWHFAANLHFEESREADIMRDNVGGTLRMLELAKKIKAKKFVYISTAYSAGRKSGVVDQTLHSVEGPFSNAYEKSKCIAENHVVEYCTQNNIEFVILRPSIVLGPMTTYSPGGSDSGIYGFVSSVHRIKDKIKNAGGLLTVIGDSRNSLNCIPVDQFVKNVLYLAENNFVSGSIFHITAQKEAPAGRWFKMLADFLRLKEIRLVLPEVRKSSTPLDKMIDRATLFYSSYLFYQKQFVTSLPFPTGITPKDMKEYLRVYLKHLEKSSPNPNAVSAINLE